MNSRHLILTTAVVCIVASPTYAQVAGFTEVSDGYSWRRASLQSRTEYCRLAAAAMAKKGTNVSAQTLFDAIQEFYTSDDSGILKQKLFQISAMVAVAGN